MNKQLNFRRLLLQFLGITTVLLSIVPSVFAQRQQASFSTQGGRQEINEFSAPSQDIGNDDYLEEDCSWGNNNVATCIVYLCEDDGVCVEYGRYCVDHYGNTVSC